MSFGFYRWSGTRFCVQFSASLPSPSTPTGSFCNMRTAHGEYRTPLSAEHPGVSHKKRMVTRGSGPSPGDSMAFDSFHGLRQVWAHFELQNFMHC